MFSELNRRAPSSGDQEHCGRQRPTGNGVRRLQGLAPTACRRRTALHRQPLARRPCDRDLAVRAGGEHAHACGRARDHLDVVQRVRTGCSAGSDDNVASVYECAVRNQIAVVDGDDDGAHAIAVAAGRTGGWLEGEPARILVDGRVHHAVGLAVGTRRDGGVAIKDDVVLDGRHVEPLCIKSDAELHPLPRCSGRRTHLNDDRVCHIDRRGRDAGWRRG